MKLFNGIEYVVRYYPTPSYMEMDDDAFLNDCLRNLLRNKNGEEEDDGDTVH